MKLIRIHCHTEKGEQLREYHLEFHPDLLAAYEAMGLIEVRDDTLDYENLRRLSRILRLKNNCGVNTVGAAIIVDLLDKIETLQDEIERLRRK